MAGSSRRSPSSEIYDAVDAPSSMRLLCWTSWPLDMTRTTRAKRLRVLDPAVSVIGLLPGSRRKEIARLLPAML